MNEEIERLVSEVEQVHADRWRIFKQLKEAEREVKRLQEELEKERSTKNAMAISAGKALVKVSKDKARLVDALKETIPYLKTHLAKSAHEFAIEFEQLLAEME